MSPKKRPKYKKGSWGEPIFEGAEVDLENGGVRRYAVVAPWAEVAAFYEACFDGLKAAIHMRTEDKKAGPIFQCAIGPKCPEPFDFEALVVLTEPKDLKRKKRKPKLHIYVTSYNVPEDFGKESDGDG